MSMCIIQREFEGKTYFFRTGWGKHTTFGDLDSPILRVQFWSTQKTLATLFSGVSIAQNRIDHFQIPNAETIEI